jgi:hypothetical protein
LHGDDKFFHFSPIRQYAPNKQTDTILKTICGATGGENLLKKVAEKFAQSKNMR